MSASVDTLRRRAIALVLLGGLACGGGSPDPTGPDPETPGPGDQQFRANLAGTAFAAVTFSAEGTSGGDGNLTLRGHEAGAGAMTVGLDLYAIPGPGTYPIGVVAGTTGADANFYSADIPAHQSPTTGSAGTVTLTTLTSTRVAGTFAFSAVNRDTDDTVAVTGGVFDLRLTKPWAPVAPTGSSRMMSARINGEPRRMYHVAGVCNDFFCMVSGSTAGYLVNFTLPPAVGPGTFAVTPGEVSIQPEDGSPILWGHAAGDGGTITVTSHTNGILKGTFSFNLGPSLLDPSAGSLSVTDGVFEVRTSTP